MEKLSTLSILLFFAINIYSQNEVPAGGTGMVTLTLNGVTATVNDVSVGNALSGDDEYIESNTQGDFSQSGNTVNIFFDVTLTNDAPVGDQISVYFSVLIITNNSISNLPYSVSIKVIEGEPTILFPVLVSPEDDTTEIPVFVLFSWIPATGATSSFLRVATDINFSNIVVTGDVSNSSAYSATLSPNTTYYWKVRCLGTSGLSDWSETWKLTTESSTGTSEQSALTKQLQGIKIYPNPSDGQFTLEGKELVGDWQVAVFNLQGQRVWADNWKVGGDNKMAIQLDFLAKGMYWLQIKDGEEQAWKKVVVQ